MVLLQDAVNASERRYTEGLPGRPVEGAAPLFCRVQACTVKVIVGWK